MASVSEHFYTECFYTWQAFTHKEALHTTSFYTQNRLHAESFYKKTNYTEKLSYT